VWAGVGARRATPPGPRLPLWGLAGYCRLDPSHPALVTYHVTTLDHAVFWIAGVRNAGVRVNSLFSWCETHIWRRIDSPPEPPPAGRAKLSVLAAMWESSTLHRRPRLEYRGGISRLLAQHHRALAGRLRRLPDGNLPYPAFGHSPQSGGPVRSVVHGCAVAGSAASTAARTRSTVVKACWAVAWSGQKPVS